MQDDRDEVISTVNFLAGTSLFVLGKRFEDYISKIRLSFCLMFPLKPSLRSQNLNSCASVMKSSCLAETIHLAETRWINPFAWASSGPMQPV